MTEKDSQNEEGVDAPEPIIERGRSLSLIWLIPIVAVIVGAVIGIDAIRNRGVHVVVTFPNAEWIEAGKTKIRYLDMEIGSVDELHINPTADGVELHCTLNRRASTYLTEGAEFWLVYPRVGAGGISGLGTLVSGAYVAMNLGPEKGKEKRLFKGLEAPPLESEHSPGLTIRLHAEDLRSLDVGSPVYYHEVRVGKIERHELEKDGSGVVLHVFFPPEHADLVREDSRFWNAGGIQISGSIPHLQIQAESLDAIVSGGIAFDSPLGEKAPAAGKDAVFWLHPSRADVDTYPFLYGGLRIEIEGARLGSLQVGDGVYYREMQVGAVTTRELMSDSRQVRVGVNIEPRYASLVRTNTVFWNASGVSASFGLHGLEVHTESIHSILNGGVAFATPDPPGDRVKAGSVFEMHGEVKDEWLKWSPALWRGPSGDRPHKTAAAAAAGAAAASGADAQSPDGGAADRIERFFHHENKSEEEAQKAGEPQKDPSQESAAEAKRHEFFGHKFHGLHRD